MEISRQVQFGMGMGMGIWKKMGKTIQMVMGMNVSSRGLCFNMNE